MGVMVGHASRGGSRGSRGVGHTPVCTEHCQPAWSLSPKQPRLKKVKLTVRFYLTGVPQRVPVQQVTCVNTAGRGGLRLLSTLSPGGRGCGACRHPGQALHSGVPAGPPPRRPRRRGPLLPSVGRRRQRGARGSPGPRACPCPRAPRAISHQGLRRPREGRGSERARHRPGSHSTMPGRAQLWLPGRDPHGPSAVSRVSLRSAARPGHRRCPVNPSRALYHARTRLPQGPGPCSVPWTSGRRLFWFARTLPTSPPSHPRNPTGACMFTTPVSRLLCTGLAAPPGHPQPGSAPGHPRGRSKTAASGGDTACRSPGTSDTTNATSQRSTTGPLLKRSQTQVHLKFQWLIHSGPTLETA